MEFWVDSSHLGNLEYSSLDLYPEATDFSMIIGIKVQAQKNKLRSKYVSQPLEKPT